LKRPFQKYFFKDEGKFEQATGVKFVASVFELMGANFEPAPKHRKNYTYVL
jgi:hypothetical protein